MKTELCFYEGNQLITSYKKSIRKNEVMWKNEKQTGYYRP